MPKFQKAKYKADFGAFNTTNCMKLKVDLKYLFACMRIRKSDIMIMLCIPMRNVFSKVDY